MENQGKKNKYNVKFNIIDVIIIISLGFISLTLIGEIIIDYFSQVF